MIMRRMLEREANKFLDAFAEGDEVLGLELGAVLDLVADALNLREQDLHIFREIIPVLVHPRLDHVERATQDAVSVGTNANRTPKEI